MHIENYCKWGPVASFAIPSTYVDQLLFISLTERTGNSLYTANMAGWKVSQHTVARSGSYKKIQKLNILIVTMFIIY
jgi:hypothetical protein